MSARRSSPADVPEEILPLEGDIEHVAEGVDRLSATDMVIMGVESIEADDRDHRAVLGTLVERSRDVMGKPLPVVIRDENDAFPIHHLFQCIRDNRRPFEPLFLEPAHRRPLGADGVKRPLIETHYY